MVVYLNGRLVPEAEAVVSVFDRAFLYGDSLFETVRICNGRPFRWHQHLERLLRSAGALGFESPVKATVLREAARSLTVANRVQEGLLRLTVTRGTGPRGYSPRGARDPVVTMVTAPLPVRSPAWGGGLRVLVSTLRVPPGDPLAGHKTGSKMLQVLARAEAEAAGADEALLVNTQGEVAEASAANVFWVRGDTIYTPPTAAGALPGVTRAVVLEICATHGLMVKKRLARADMVQAADGCFLTNSVSGISSVAELAGTELPGSPWVGHIREWYDAVLRKECGGAGDGGDG